MAFAAAEGRAVYDAAQDLASAHGLKLLELVTGDGTLISSAEWPARFGYKEDWLAAGEWNSGSAFLRREELPDGFTLALAAVGTAVAGDRKLYVVGGQRLDPATDGRPDPRLTVRENVPQLGDLLGDFDFSQAARAPLVLPTNPPPGPASIP